MITIFTCFIVGRSPAQQAPVVTYLNQITGNLFKSGNRSLQETLTAKATALQARQPMMSGDSYSKTGKGGHDNRRPIVTSNSELYEKAERNMCCSHKIIDDPTKLIKHELRAWKQRKKEIKGIFILDKNKLKRLARKAGMMKEVDGFVYNYKHTHGAFAQSGFPRPTFETAWKYHVLNSRSFAAVGHLLRILHCCLRWDVINIRPPKGVNHSITTSKG